MDSNGNSEDLLCIIILGEHIKAACIRQSTGENCQHMKETANWLFCAKSQLLKWQTPFSQGKSMPKWLQIKDYNTEEAHTFNLS